MAALTHGFNPQEHDTTQNDFELLPTGIYRLEIIASDMKADDNDQSNLAVNLTYSVIEPEEYKGRRFFSWIDYQHKDAKKQEDGQKALSRLCRAVGYDKPFLEDTEELHLISMTAMVEHSPAGTSKAGLAYKAKNRIKKFYYPDEDNAPEPFVDVQPAKTAPPARPVAANNNRPSANDNRPTAATAPAAKRPWATKK